jgi:hypothetical protein
MAPLGADTPVASDARLTSQPSALRIDGLTRDYVQDSAGRLVGEHPIDAKFFHRIRVASGTIRSAPGTGQGVSNLKWIDPKTIDAFVLDQVNLVSADMIAAGEIQVHGIIVDHSVRSRVVFGVDYTNLRTGGRQTVSP